MRRLLSTAAILLVSGCLGDLLNIGEGPEEKGGDGKETGGTGGGSGSSGASGASGTDAGGDGGAGDDTGGSSSRGGATGGGSGGSGDPGGGGSGAAGGTSGSGGTSGAGGIGEPTSDPDVIARAALVLGSCYGDDRSNRTATWLWNSLAQSGFWGHFRLQAECIAEAGGGCGALDTCLGWGIEEKPGCTPGHVCDGSRHTYCVEEDGRAFEWRIDCATLGASCDAAVFCIDGPAVACEQATYVENCVGNLPQQCSSDPEGSGESVVLTGPDCTELGLECVAETRGTDNPIFAKCTGTGAECEWSPEIFAVPLACTGTTLEACVNARRHEFDCSTFGQGFTCQSFDGISFCGLASECRPGDVVDADYVLSQQGNPEPACDGTTLVFCNAGRLERIDCTDFGFTGCDVEDGLGCVPSPTSAFH